MAKVDRYSRIITIAYASIYTLIILITSIYSAYDTYKIHHNSPTKKVDIKRDKTAPKQSQFKGTTESKEESIEIELENVIKSQNGPDADDNDDGDSLSCFKFLKLWSKDFWSKKKIFIAIVPHLIDQATDIGTIWTYYDAFKQNKASQWFWIIGTFIVIFQRIISSATIYFLTRNITSTILQMMDLLMVKAIYINYYFKLSEPCNPQRYLSILEAVFESAPQIILSVGFILKAIGNNTTESVSSIVIISICASLWSLASKVSADDKELFDEEKEKQFRSLDIKFDEEEIQFNWQYLIRLIFWRVFEISSRVSVAVLLWMNCGGLAFFLIISMEMAVCFIISIQNKMPDPMANVMYISFASAGNITNIFRVYRVISSYIYLAAITFFALVPVDAAKIEDHELRYKVTIDNEFGMTLLIYGWIATPIWQCALYWIYQNAAHFGKPLRRNVESCMTHNAYKDAFQLMIFGVKSRALDLDAKNDEGNTPLHIAVSNDYTIIIKNILDGGCNPNIKNNKGDAPLHIAVRKGSDKLSQQLIEAKCEVNIKNNAGETALHIAVKNGHDTLSQQLLDANCNMNIKNNEGDTPLHIAAKKGYDKISQQLIDAKCDINIKDNEGKTAAFYARYYGRYKIIQKH